ncbi:MAG TPA: radical SAM protein [Myxococcota bacterium]|nr:radical SAM protein [Myxococcota bacterium]HRY94052.1 radical SAM protein [Myxococcota bacterium]
MANLGYIQVTRLCNQRCLFCSNPELPVTLGLEESWRQLEKLKAADYDGVILTGGEPSMHPELETIVRQAREVGLAVRIITNGQKTSNLNYLKKLKKAGLSHLHFSVHSVREEVQAFLSGNPDSWDNLLGSFENAGKLGLAVDVNTVMCAQNADHLDENVRFLVQRFPFIHHFVWNNIDPKMNRVSENPHTLAKLADLELSLHRAMRFLEECARTFRIERLPLCYMAEFAHTSTETRKIVKGEERTVHFLDAKGEVRQVDFFHDKGRACSACLLSSICAGLYDLNGAYREDELYALFLDPEPIIDRIKGEP